jgi:hypothetical protein
MSLKHFKHFLLLCLKDVVLLYRREQEGELKEMDRRCEQRRAEHRKGEKRSE